jgi:ribonucleoside-diphosphate reductase alpha chain
MFDPNEGLLEIVEVNGAVETGSSVVVSQRSVQPERRYGFIPREKFDNINTGKGLRIQRFFTQPGVDPFDTVEWERRTAVIAGERGEVVFEQKDVEVPAFWSQLATNVVASKYFRGQIGTPEREHSVRQVIGRVVETLTRWGREMGYFASEQDAEAFRDELKHLLLYQYAAFNSPVWFNVGIEPRPQCSACFIVSVEDTMESILDLAKTEGMIFKFGSGSGSNLSRIRGSKEYLSGGGRASGPVSFMRGFDAFAGVIKSGGKTRRAAKMVVLNIDHPDIVDFIECKAKEEKKAWALIEAGYDPGFDTPGGAYDSVFFQNANHSVRVTDEFMRAVEQDGEWCTYARTTGAVMGRYRARELFRKIAEAAWVCGDPGLQFHDTTNKWHTVKNSGPIEASNPCSEFVFLNDTSCNLASLNLMKFRLPDGRFDVEAFRAAVRILITAQEIIVDNSAYPTERICDNSHNFRPLGLGYANLGALLMSLGLPYDSDAGRAYAAIITAIMHGEAYRQSAMIARDCGAPFPGFALNREPMLEVMRMHADALNQIPSEYVPDYLLQTAREIYQEMLQLGEQYGYRNAQVTVLAPTGTISFMMDCDTTGIEPDIALVKYKTLVGGGMLKIVNTTVPLALQQLGYSPEQIEAITRYIDEHDTIEGAPYLKEEHLPVFDCAFRPAKGTRSLAPMAHVKMMAAVQPFLSGAISKCVTGETLLFTDRGILPIEQLYRGEKPDTFRPCSLKVASIDTPQEADLFYYGGFRPTIRLTLQDGRIIEGTPNHRIKVANRHGYGWKRLDEVEPGDFVAIRLGAEMWSSQNVRFDDFQPSPLYGGQKAIRIPQEMTPDLARLLGYYIAEGNMTRSNWTVRITNNDLGVLHRCQHLLRDLFDLESQIVTDARNGVTSVVATSKTLVEFLEYLGCRGKASEKQIPWAVLQSRREVVQAFVSALWLDGYIRRDGMVAICLASEKLLRQLQVVLNNFGIRANLIRKYAKTTDRFYTELTMCGESVVRFAALFDLDEAHKRERLAESVQYANRGAVHSDVVPCFREQLQDAIRAARRTHQWRQLFDPRTQHLSWNTVACFYQHYPLSELQEMVNNNIHFVPVMEIESRFAPVYDLQVPGNHAFLGNCVVNHNTVNMPHDATPEDIEQIYMQAWKMGLKAIAIYRDGSKRTQPLSTKKPSEQESQLPVPTERPVRRHLPDERRSITHKFSIAGHEGYITVGMYEDGTPGEIFITMAKEGSVISGLMDAFATAISLALQYGVPLEKLVEKFSYTRFQPSGFTNNPQIPVATSIVDYIFRWLGMKFLNQQPPQRQPLETLEEPSAPPVASATAQPEAVGITGAKETPPSLTPTGQGETMDWSQLVKLQQDAPPCPVCGMIMVRAGACHQCLNCGTSYGCS